MADPVVNKWKQNGHVYLWTYLENTKNYPGWHMRVDQPGGESLLDLLDKMVSSEWPSTKEILISSPTLNILKCPNNKNGRAKWSSVKKLKIKYPTGEVPHNHWSLVVVENRVDLVIGLEKLNLLRQGIKDSLSCRGDYSIGSDDSRVKETSLLWFW